jgi:hypothetical protein
MVVAFVPKHAILFYWWVLLFHFILRIGIVWITHFIWNQMNLHSIRKFESLPISLRGHGLKSSEHPPCSGQGWPAPFSPTWSPSRPSASTRPSPAHPTTSVLVTLKPSLSSSSRRRPGNLPYLWSSMEMTLNPNGKSRGAWVCTYHEH